jgi:penicillin G amidase
MFLKLSRTQIFRTVAAAVMVAALAPPAGPIRAGSAGGVTGQQRLKGLRARVEIVRDRLGIPHIYAGSAEDAYFALGYLHATDRLFQMEVFRRRAEGRLAEMFGRRSLDDDTFMRELGIQQLAERAWKNLQANTEAQSEMEAYCRGVNARIAEVSPDKLSGPFRGLGVKPAPWTPVDALAFPLYMGWDQSGTDTDVWMGMLVEKLGLQTVEELFPLDRPYEIPTVAAGPPSLSPGSIAAPGSTGAAALFPPGYDQAATELHRHFVAGRMAGPYARGSNNWAIDGAKSATGKPLLANDPHLGLTIPSIWYTAQVEAPELDVIGVTFAGFPYVIIGHNDRMAWGLTNMQADAVDYFIEKTDAARPHQYFYQGEWREMLRRVEEIPIRGESPARLEVESTVHGPLVTEHGTRLALCWTGLSQISTARAFRLLNRARGLADYRAALRDLTVPALNVIYADVDGNIVISPHGALPIRKRGDGRWPVDGSSGDFDWVGFIPDDRLPISINPPSHYLASANGRPTSVGYPYYLGWEWDPSYRTRRIHSLLSSHHRIRLEQMQAFQTDVHDAAAESFVPVLLAAYDRKPFGDATVKQAIDQLRRWDFEARPQSAAPTIWSAWFKQFRADVWQDDFDKAGVEPWPGGWGFADSNERQPELEVLEFLTREVPNSPWFDDVRTPERETRDDILARSFVEAVAELTESRGPDVSAWQWGRTNVLELHSITGDANLDRGGIAIGGDDLTLAPGGNGQAVTGGASWRMVVDLGDLERSVGMFPGGESEDPASTHYDDQVRPWAQGHYLPLYFYSSPAGFKQGQLESRMVLEPAP